MGGVAVGVVVVVGVVAAALGQMVPYTLGGTTVMVDGASLGYNSPLLEMLRNGMSTRRQGEGGEYANTQYTNKQYTQNQYTQSQYTQDDLSLEDSDDFKTQEDGSLQIKVLPTSSSSYNPAPITINEAAGLYRQPPRPLYYSVDTPDFSQVSQQIHNIMTSLSPSGAKTNDRAPLDAMPYGATPLDAVTFDATPFPRVPEGPATGSLSSDGFEGVSVSHTVPQDALRPNNQANFVYNINDAPSDAESNNFNAQANRESSDLNGATSSDPSDVGGSGGSSDATLGSVYSVYQGEASLDDAIRNIQHSLITADHSTPYSHFSRNVTHIPGQDSAQAFDDRVHPDDGTFSATRLTSQQQDNKSQVSGQVNPAIEGAVKPDLEGQVQPAVVVQVKPESEGQIQPEVEGHASNNAQSEDLTPEATEEVTEANIEELNPEIQENVNMAAEEVIKPAEGTAAAPGKTAVDIGEVLTAAADALKEDLAAAEEALRIKEQQERLDQLALQEAMAGLFQDIMSDSNDDAEDDEDIEDDENGGDDEEENGVDGEDVDGGDDEEDDDVDNSVDEDDIYDLDEDDEYDDTTEDPLDSQEDIEEHESTTEHPWDSLEDPESQEQTEQVTPSVIQEEITDSSFEEQEHTTAESIISEELFEEQWEPTTEASSWEDNDDLDNSVEPTTTPTEEQNSEEQGYDSQEENDDDQTNSQEQSAILTNFPQNRDPQPSLFYSPSLNPSPFNTNPITLDEAQGVYIDGVKVYTTRHDLNDQSEHTLTDQSQDDESGLEELSTEERHEPPRPGTEGLQDWYPEDPITLYDPHFVTAERNQSLRSPQNPDDNTIPHGRPTIPGHQSPHRDADPSNTTYVTFTGAVLRPANLDPATCSCGLRINTKIVGGEETTIENFPWMAGISRISDGFVFCGGSIINDRYILTAAHCTSGQVASELQVRVGETTRTGPALTIGVNRIIQHKGYEDNDITRNDISLLELKQSIQFDETMLPVCLAQGKNMYAGRKAVVSGWGKDASIGGSVQEVLHEVEVDVLSTQQCRKNSFYKKHEVHNGIVCASSPSKDACQGDSGGPIVVLEGDRYYQIGVVSWGIGCAEADYPGIYTRVSKFSRWINKSSKKGKSCQTMRNTNNKNKKNKKKTQVEYIEEEEVETNNNKGGKDEERNKSDENVDELKEEVNNKKKKNKRKNSGNKNNNRRKNNKNRRKNNDKDDSEETTGDEDTKNNNRKKQKPKTQTNRNTQTSKNKPQTNQNSQPNKNNPQPNKNTAQPSKNQANPNKNSTGPSTSPGAGDGRWWSLTDALRGIASIVVGQE